MSKVCSKCGKTNVDDAIFCKNCGAKLEQKNNKDEQNKKVTVILWITVIFLAIVMMILLFSVNKNSTEANATEMNATEANATEANATEANATEANSTAAEANTTAAAAPASGVDGAAAFKACSACHGADGKQVALGKSAIIAGQSVADIESKLKEYKAGTRDVTGNGAVMKGQAANLSDDQIKALATYINSLDSYPLNNNMQSDEQTYHQDTLFSQDKVKNFLESHLHSGCFRSINDVSYFFSRNIYRYYNFTNPTLQMIFDDNIKYCAKWSHTEYGLNSFNLLSRYYKNGSEYADVVENVSYTASNSNKKIIGTIDLFLTLLNENGQIRIVSIYSQNNQKRTYFAQPENINQNDYLKPYAYELITGKELIIPSDIIVNYNSKGNKIYCLSDMSICKTESEVLDYFNNR